MDPLSITTACVGLASTITTLSLSMTTFIRDMADAKSDIDNVNHELLSLKSVLDLIAHDVKNTSLPLPKNLEILPGVISNCSRVVEDIDKCIKAHDGTRIQKRARWVTIGKGDMAKLKSTLEAHKVTLGLALDMISFTAPRDVQHDTFAAKQNIEVIMRDSKEILEAIAKLQTKSFESSREISNSYTLSRYLNELTTYTESVYEYAESNLEEISIFSPTDTHQSLPSSPVSGLISGHLMEERNEHGEGSLCQIWASEETPSPLSSRVSLEPHEQPLSLRSRTTIEEFVDNHYAEPEESLREPQSPRPETSSSSSTPTPSISGSAEPLPFMSESVPQAIESLRQVSDQSVVPKGGSDPQDAPTSTLTTATVFGTTLEESLCYAGVNVGVIDRWLSSHGAPTTMQGLVPIVVSQCFKFLQAKETRGLPVQLPSLRRRNVEKRSNKLRRAFEIAAKDGTELTPDLLHRGGFNDQDMKDILLSYFSSLPERLVHLEVNSDQFSFYLRLITKSRRGKLSNAECLEIMNFLGRKTCSLPMTNHFILLYLLNELEMCHKARRVSRDYIQDLGQAVFSIPLESPDLGDDVAGQLMFTLVTEYTTFQEFSRIRSNERYSVFTEPVIWENHLALMKEEELRREAARNKPRLRQIAELKDQKLRREKQEKEQKFWASVAGD